MPRIDTAQRIDRKTAILDAAERCFVRSGFHGASMSDICGEAGMSPGNLYRYFPSKEAMIEGLCERDFAEVGEGFSALAQAPDIWTAFEALARFHMIEEPRESCQLWVEIMSEVARNPQIGILRRKIDQFIEAKIRFALETARDRGQTDPGADLDRAVQFLITYADGLMLRRARDVNFDPDPHVVLMFSILRSMLLPPATPATARLKTP
ncbi:MAG: TetR/AcrR family transcriptional regulator [Phreatobacter sp.]|uniref:TetR/AcrR family transcriptional regulator n=1 Tax=Phreatobacter sp. TaxID=1966341 RepID=UPI0027351AB2|nr:TetR/AcrR family transcriptional regulator [Phreatobacter sp.]MDP2802792.1 TetR/AcrR family transcriptional regulator [Phreatobacter sp.]